MSWLLGENWLWLVIAGLIGFVLTVLWMLRKVQVTESASTGVTGRRVATPDAPAGAPAAPAPAPFAPAPFTPAPFAPAPAGPAAPAAPLAGVGGDRPAAETPEVPAAFAAPGLGAPTSRRPVPDASTVIRPAPEAGTVRRPVDRAEPEMRPFGFLAPESAGAQPLVPTPKPIAPEPFAPEPFAPEPFAPATEAIPVVEETPTVVPAAFATPVAEAPVTEEVPVVPEPPVIEDAPVAEEAPAAFAAPLAEPVGGQQSAHGAGSVNPLPDGSSPHGDFTVKGNAESMKYHTSDSPYYGRTVAEVWFDSEDSARAAGFRHWRDRT